jgi:pimeloyl-ACP methyl ester carboxylesterase
MPKIFANGINIYYETHGDSTSPPLVLVGGLSRDHNIWNPVIEYLIPHFKIFLPDNRGAGQTDKPVDDYTTEILGDDLAAFLIALKIEPAHIVGHSMGGFAAQYLAAKHPGLVSSLILCSTCSKQSNHGIAYLTERLSLLQSGTMPPEEMIRSTLPWLYTTKYLTEERIQAFVKNGQANPFPIPKHALEAQTQACISHDATNILSSITAPTLVITGKEDKVMTPEVSLALKNQISNAVLILIDNAAHMVQIETPDVLSKIITMFTQTIKS